MWKRLLIPLAIVLCANLVALLTVERNASGTPDAVVVLTERELRPPMQTDDNTGMTLRLRLAQDESPAGAREYAWFDRAKLASVGFDCRTDPRSADAEKRYRSAAYLPRTTWLVLEYRDATTLPSDDTEKGKAAGGASGAGAGLPPSRLHAVDAGNDPAALRRQYPDRTRFIVTRGSVRLTFLAKAQGGPIIRGRVANLTPSEVYVPRAWVGAIGNPRTAQFAATVQYGQAYLPTVVRVTAAQEGASAH